MINFRFLICMTLLLCVKPAFSQIPTVYMIDGAHLSAQKLSYRKGKAEIVKEVAVVIAKADALLNDKPQSVMEKAFTPPSGSKHDYMSMAPYFWPDPSKPDGLPYIRKDGEHNPEIKKISDHDFLSELCNKCKYLSLAWYFTGDEKYAAKARQLISVWFLEPDTKMNPNLNYAQSIRGVNDGRGIGIIETRGLADLADWMGLLEGSKAFTDADLARMKAWYKEYLNWMITSKNGNDEHNAKNNHGTHYDTQIVSFALFTGNNDLAKKTLEEDKKRISVQIQPDGQQPLELERTNAYGYSTMNLNGWFNLAILADNTGGVDLWNYVTPDGRTLRKALDYLLPYALDDKKRDHQQIGPYNKMECYRLLVLAGEKYNNTAYTKRAIAMTKNDEAYITDLLY